MRHFLWATRGCILVSYWHSERAAKKYGLDTRTILNELGKRKMVGGQEDMIVDVALDLLRQQKENNHGA